MAGDKYLLQENLGVSMLHTEQLSPDTLVVHVRGLCSCRVVKELSLLISCSFHLAFRNFLCDMSRAVLLDETAEQQLALIGEGLREKGGTWRVINAPSRTGKQLVFRTTHRHFTFKTWI